MTLLSLSAPGPSQSNLRSRTLPSVASNQRRSRRSSSLDARHLGDFDSLSEAGELISGTSGGLYRCELLCQDQNRHCICSTPASWRVSCVEFTLGSLNSKPSSFHRHRACTARSVRERSALTSSSSSQLHLRAVAVLKCELFRLLQGIKWVPISP